MSSNILRRIRFITETGIKVHTMSVFLGIGLGPIQTGIFLSGAAKGGFDRIVVAEVDAKLCEAVRKGNGRIAINIAGRRAVSVEEMAGVEILNPSDTQELAKLHDAAAAADEIATALPSVKFYRNIAPWLSEGFRKNPDRRRFIYTSENDNHAAEILAEMLGREFRSTFCLNTVIGKMSGVVDAEGCARRGLRKLTPSADRGHLVEEFSKILISSCPGVEERRMKGLHVKNDLLPFEEAKLYGHNAIHVLLGLHAIEKGLEYMYQLREHPSLMRDARTAFIDECGRALRKKWKGVDTLFTEAGFMEYADDLLERMTNPLLEDKVDRICRDLSRKLGWKDRIVGTIRLVLDQGFKPDKLLAGARIAAEKAFGADRALVSGGLEKLWAEDNAPRQEMERLLSLLARTCIIPG